MELPSQMPLLAYRRRAESSSIPIISPQTEIFLGRCVVSLSPQSYCEIGTAVWYSMSVVYEAMKWLYNDGIWTKKKVYFLTGFDVSLIAYRHAVARSTYYTNAMDDGERSWLKFPQPMVSRHIFPFDICSIDAHGRTVCLQPSYDMIFIDARKILYTRYCEILVPYCKQTSMVIFDDMTTSSSKTQSLYTFLQKLQWKMIRVYPWDGDSLLVTWPSGVDRCCARCDELGMAWKWIEGGE